MLFITGNWNAKVGSQEIPGVTGKFGLGVQNEAGQKLEFCQKNTLVIANTLFQQHKRRLYTWTSPDGQYENKHIFGDHYLPLLKAWHVSGIVLSTLHELTVLRGSYYLFFYYADETTEAQSC